MPYAQPDAGGAPAGARAVRLPGQSIIDGTHSRAATVLPPAPSTRTRNLNPRWDRVIMGCLALAPEDRIQDAEEVLHELTDKRIRKTPFVAAALMIVVLAAIWWWRRPLANYAFDKYSMAPLTETGNVSLADISPDGKYLAYTDDESGKQNLWLHQVATASTVRLFGPVVRPDARTALHARRQLHLLLPVGSRRSGRNLYRIPTVGGVARKVAARRFP